MNSKSNKHIFDLVNETVSQGKKTSTTVQFDSKTSNPWKVVFSQRGFSVEDTRLSFELLDDAISKNYSITLDGGQGMALDPVKMQKILKYKDLY